MSSSILSLMHKVELLKRVAENPSIPSPPGVILRVLEKASKPECTINDLSSIIQIDPGLAGKMLRFVNSALFGLSRPVASVQRALTVVGTNSARLLLLAISLPQMQQTQQLDAARKQRYWRLSVAGAIVARELALRLNVRDSEDDMAIGLLRDLGELVLQQMFPREYQGIFEEGPEVILRSQCELEEHCCGLNHAEVSAFILNRWRLPTDMTEAIRHHHDPDCGTYSSPTAERRAYVLHFATRAAQLLVHPEHPALLRGMLDLAQQRFGMNEDQVHEFLRPLTKKMTEFATLLHVDLGETSSFSSVLTRASEELVHLSISANLDNQRATEMTRRAESEAQRWRNEAAFDSLTKLFNRRFFEMKLEELYARSKTNESNLGLLFVDLDGFKPLNDRFGHAFGDLVLQQIADCLNRAVRQGDVVARYGGDEFCILTESADALGVKALGQRVLQTINELTVYQGANAGKVGASIGAVCHQSRLPWNSPQEFLAAADRAMYQAKSAGKNRVYYLETTPELRSLATPVREKHGTDQPIVA